LLQPPHLLRRDVWIKTYVIYADVKGAEFLQKRALMIIFAGSEYATNLIIANVETPSQDDSKLSQLFFRRS